MIANTFIKRPVTAIVISIVIVLIGVLAIFSLPVGQYPDITPPSVSISAAFTGADATTVEQTVTTPIETQVNGTPGMAYITSNSTSSGQSSINVVLDQGTDPDVATMDIQNRVGIATPQLPDLVKRLGVITRKRTSSILMIVAIYSPNHTHDISFLDNYTNIFVKDALLRVNGVGDIFVRADDFSMRVWLNPNKLAQLGLTTSDVTNALAGQNLQVAAGTVGAPPQNSDQTFEYTVFTNSKLNSVEQFGNIIVRVNPQDGSEVHLKDVATIQLGKASYASNSYIDGERSSFLLIFQAPGSNALEVAQGVYDKMKEIKKSFPEDVNYGVPFEAVSVVRESIDEVVVTLLEALGLVVLVVFLFLQNWRATIIPILAIPVSIIGTFALFLPLGYTINTLTMFGFVLAIGIVVDDAIIVVEAVQHHIDEEKLSPKEATKAAMNDISGPVIAIALILASVFIPVGFIPGIVGKLYQQFAITIAVSVLISAFVALSLTPALCSLILQPTNFNKTSKGFNKFFFKFNEWFKKTTNNYSEGVRKSIRIAPYFLIVLILVYAGTILLFMNKPTAFIPQEDEGRLYITYELPEAASTTRSIDVLKRMMAILEKTPGIGHFAAINGLNVVTFASKSNSGTIFTQLKPWNERTSKALQLNSIMATLRRKFSVIKSANVIVISPPAIPGLGRTGGFSFELEQQESTNNIQQFAQVVQNFVIAANKKPELSNVFSFFTASTPAYQLNVDREKCAQLGIPVADVYSTIQTLLGSSYVNDFTIYGRDFHVVAQADTNYRSTIHDLSKYYVRNTTGKMIPLSTVINYKITESAPLISHYNLFRSTEINGSAAPGYSSGQAIEALREVAAQVLPAGYGYEFSGLSREEIKSGSSTFMIFGLSLVFVFLFLSALYESWSVPFAVLFAVPIAAFGAIVALILQPHLSDNVYAQIGLVALIGLAAKNAILIVEFAKTRVDGGMPLLTATLNAVRLRLRPILMTSMAFVFGVSPLIFASGAGAQARQTIGWTVIGGMLAATMLAIFIVPVLFVTITRIAYGRKKLEDLERKGIDENIQPESS
ncbi:MAG: multidrug efflux RND transporter permease subunit [Ignavibacteriaceae bacterium]